MMSLASWSEPVVAEHSADVRLPLGIWDVKCGGVKKKGRHPFVNPT